MQNVVAVSAAAAAVDVSNVESKQHNFGNKRVRYGGHGLLLKIQITKHVKQQQYRVHVLMRTTA